MWDHSAIPALECLSCLMGSSLQLLHVLVPFLKGTTLSFLIAVLGWPETAAKEFFHGIFSRLSVVPTALQSPLI